MCRMLSVAMLPCRNSGIDLSFGRNQINVSNKCRCDERNLFLLIHVRQGWSVWLEIQCDLFRNTKSRLVNKVQNIQSVSRKAELYSIPLLPLLSSWTEDLSWKRTCWESCTQLGWTRNHSLCFSRSKILEGFKYALTVCGMGGQSLS